MIACPSLMSGGSAGISAALRSVDCRTGEATAYAFGRLFGADGRLLTALTLLLTIYVALFAIGLLTGRTRIGVAALTPRMLTLGLVLTFATSWAAYQNVVWTLATGAPDQVATLVAGTHGSATTAFADRLDRLFAAVADAAQAAAKPAPTTETGITPATTLVGGFSASTVLWLSALLLLLGTVGVLVTSKIALAAMLALGPVFIVLSLFKGTRGLFEGWLKGVVLFACVPLFAVLIGGGAVVAMEPIVSGIAGEGGQPSSRAVAVLFLGSSVYCALLVMAIKTATTLVSGWRLFGADRDLRDSVAASGSATSVSGAPPMLIQGGAARGPSSSPSDERVRGIVASLPAPADSSGGSGGGMGRARQSAQVIPIAGAAPPPARIDHRVQGLGSRFRAQPAVRSKEQIS
ncbi:type IV secretion system protein [uncultured Sphingomonas sp.]|uniref:type IV secretion system protein n=1 Tax=uncultured Sphingomonas sp. TaxID=158754 RepID=UPI002608982C|nr:type IV secretion system protein [uncultured Sphingomonas sp.]